MVGPLKYSKEERSLGRIHFLGFMSPPSLLRVPMPGAPGALTYTNLSQGTAKMSWGDTHDGQLLEGSAREQIGAEGAWEMLAEGMCRDQSAGFLAMGLHFPEAHTAGRE